MNEQAERLKLLFRRTGNLPPLNATATALIRSIDEGEGSLLEVEQIIASDPFISSNILRMALLEPRSRNEQRPVTLLSAISTLGLRAIRSLAIALAVKPILIEDFHPDFNRELFRRHCFATGVIASFLFARRHKLGLTVTCSWSNDEIFAAGILHDLSIALLARTSPSDFARVAFAAKRHSTSIDSAFFKLYEIHVGEIGSIAAAAWGMPDLFVKSLLFRENPWALPEEFDGLACLAVADYLARNQFGYSDVAWETSNEVLDPMVAEDNELTEEEGAEVMRRLDSLAGEYLTSPVQRSNKAGLQ